MNFELRLKPKRNKVFAIVCQRRHQVVLVPSSDVVHQMHEYTYSKGSEERVLYMST